MGYSIDQSNMTPEKVEETALAMRVLEKLTKEFPGYELHVTVAFNKEIVGGGVCTVRPDFAGEFSYMLPLDAIIHDPSLNLVKWAGGEFLERFYLPRVRANQDLIDSLEVNARGFATPQR